MSAAIIPSTSTGKILPSEALPPTGIAEEKQDVQPTFFQEFSDEETLLSFLASRENKNVTTSHSLPAPSTSMGQEALDFFTDVQELSIENKSVFFALGTPLDSIQPTALIHFIGGYVRKAVVREKTFVVDTLSRFSSQEKQLLEPYVTDAILSESRRVLPDYDLRIPCYGATKEKLFAKIKAVQEYFVALTGKSAEWLKEHRVILKFELVDLPTLCYAIISYKSSKGRIDLIFLSKAARPFLFTTDAWCISVTRHKKNPIVSLQTAHEQPEQTYFDLLGKRISIPNPQTVDQMGLAILASYFSRSFVLADEEALPIIRATAFTLTERYFDAASQMSDLLSTALQSHHPGDADAAVTTACNALIYLQQLLDEPKLKQIWQHLIKDQPNSTLLQIVMHTEAPIRTLLAALTVGSFIAVSTRPPKNGLAIRQHGEKPAIQVFCPDAEHTLLIPLDLDNALSLLQKSGNIDSLLPLIEHLVFQHANPIASGALPQDLFKRLHLDPQTVKANAFALLESKNPSLRLLGFLLGSTLLTTGPLLDQTGELVKRLPEFAVGRDPHLQRYLARVLQLSGNQSLAGAVASYHSEREVDWIKGLAALQDAQCTKLAVLRWKELRQSCTLQERQTHDLAIAILLLPQGYAPAVAIAIRYFQEQQDTKGVVVELTLVNKLLLHASLLETKMLSAGASMLVSCLKQLIDRHDQEALEPLTDALEKYINRLIKKGLFEDAKNVLDLVLPCLAGITYVWKKWADEVVKDPATITLLAETLQSLAEPVEVRAEAVYVAALQKLLLNQPTEQTALAILAHIRNHGQISSSVATVVEVKVTALFNTIKNPGDFEHLFTTTYEHYLPQLIQQRILERLFEKYLVTLDIESALRIWKRLVLMEPTSSLQALTLRLIDHLKSNSDLPLLQHVLLDAARVISAEQHANYQIALFDATQGKVRATQVESLLSTIRHRLQALQPPTRLQIAERALEGVQGRNLQPPILRLAAPELIQTFAENKRFSDADRVIQLAGELDSPFLIGYYKQAIDYCLASKGGSGIITWLDALKDVDETKKFARYVLDLVPQASATVKVRMLVSYAQELQQHIDKKTIAASAYSILGKEGVGAQTVESLLKLYPPEKCDTWIALISKALPEQLPLMWPQLKGWIVSQKAASTEVVMQMNTLVQALSTTHPHSPIFLELVELALEENSPVLQLLLPDSVWGTKSCLAIIRCALQSSADKQRVQKVYELHCLLSVAYIFKSKTIELSLQVLVQMNTESSIESALALMAVVYTNGQEFIRDYEELAKQAVALIQAALSFSKRPEIASKINFLCAQFIPRLPIAYSLQCMSMIAKHPSRDFREVCNNFLSYFAATKQTLDSLSPESCSDYARILGTSVLASIPPGSLLSPGGQKQAFGQITRVGNTTRSDPETFSECVDFATHLLSKQLERAETCAHFSKWAKALFEQFFHSKVKEHVLNRCQTVYIDYPARTSQDPTIEQFEDHFFTAMERLIEKLLGQHIWSEQQVAIANRFIYLAITRLFLRFPHRRLKPSLIESYVARTPHYMEEEFDIHFSSTKEVIKTIAPQFKGEMHLLAKSLILVDADVDLVRSSCSRGNKRNVLLQVLELKLSHASNKATALGALILNKYQAIFLENNPGELLQCYKKLFEQIPTDQNEEEPLYELYRKTCFEQESPTTLARQMAKNSSFATQLGSCFLDNMYTLYDKLPDDPDRRYRLLSHIEILLHKLIEKDAFRCREGRQLRIHYYEKIIGQTLILLKRHPDFALYPCSELIERALAELLQLDPERHKALKNQWDTFLSEHGTTPEEIKSQGDTLTKLLKNLSLLDR